MISLGIIGAGRIGKVHAQSIMNHITSARLKTIADPFMNEETEASLRVLGVSDCTKDYKKILNDPEIDAVLICSSTNTHADISLEAIAAGKHVFCEKPVSQDIAKIRQVMEKLKGTKLKYQVGFNRRFDHNFEAVRAAVANGDVGDVHIVRITSRDPAPPPPEYAAVSGGMFLDMTIHDFDMVRYLTASDVVEVFANGAVLVDPLIGKAGDIDTAIISLKMANGALAVIDNSRKAVYGYDQRAEVFGSKGQASVSNDTNSSLILSSETGIHTEKPLYFFLERYMASFTKEVRMFVQAIEQDSPVPVDINDGLQPVLIAAAALRSLKEHRPVLLSEIK
jgi:oxidoreductase domain protein